MARKRRQDSDLFSVWLSRRAKSEYQKRVINSVGIWAAYYRENINRFAADYLHLSLRPFQQILLLMMNLNSIFVWIACRGIGKSFLCAIFCVCRAILYPGSKIVIASGTRGQSINVLEKIIAELKPLSPELCNEINESESSINATTAKISFHNGSYIKVVTSSDNSRSNRAHVLILDEFRMIKKDVIDTVLRKFLAGPRMPGYMELPEYKNRIDLLEPHKTLFFSSAWYKGHWSFTKCRDACRLMLGMPDRKNFVCGIPYQLAVKDGLLMRDEIMNQITESDFNEITFSMEMLSEFFGETDGSFFSFDVVSKNRKIDFVQLPPKITDKAACLNKFKIQPKQPGEKRILSADIALMASSKHKNDATAIFINSMMPTKASRYVSNIIYTENNEGMHTEDQALQIRRLYEEYDCDYIVLDTRNVGLSIFDALARDMTDPDTGEIYPAISCCNSDDIAARCTVEGAEKVVWAVMGSSKFNSECAVHLREGFRTGRIRLPSPEYDVEDTLVEIKGYNQLSAEDKVAVKLPYINISLLVNELINLRYDDSGGAVKLTERSTTERKDRYSSLSYNYYVALQIEMKLRKYESLTLGDQDEFIIRAPKRRKR